MKGIDPQLLKAVEVVSSDVREWKAKKTGGATPGGTASPVPTPAPGSGSPTPMPGTPLPKTPVTPSSPPRTEADAGRIPLAE
jgi:hypothetical protein